MPFPVKEDVSANPIDVGALGSATVMLRANRLTNSIEQLRRTSRCDRDGRSLRALPLHDAPFFHCQVLQDDDGIVNADRSTTRQPEATQDNSNGDRHELEPQPTILTCRRSRISRAIVTRGPSWPVETQ